MTTYERTVTAEDTAVHLGSGDLPVLATPRLINWVERAAFAEAATVLEDGQTTVGTMVRIEHVKGCPVGEQVTVTCAKPKNDGRRLIFHVTATDEHGDTIATGEVHRAVVDRERFLRKLGGADPAVETTPEPLTAPPGR